MPISAKHAGRRLAQAQTGLLAALAIVIVGIGIVAGYRLSPPREATRFARTFVRVLKLETPTLIPTGRLSRNPGYTNRSVDLRPTPLLPTALPDPETLLYPR
jgi:hypothetical protein